MFIDISGELTAIIIRIKEHAKQKADIESGSLLFNPEDEGSVLFQSVSELPVD
jgi:hypothetical protein